MDANRELQNEYRATWDAFSRALDQLQSSVETGGRDRVDAALLLVEKARLAHNDARDRLAAQFIVGKAAALAHLPELPEEFRVRRTARLLWELSGKPQGTAECDWLRAERLVRSAGA